MNNKDDFRIFRIIGELIERLSKISKNYQREISAKCLFNEDKNSDARVALMGFLTTELISIYFQYYNIKELYFQDEKRLNHIRKPLKVGFIRNNEILKILISSLRQNTRISIFTLLESGNRFCNNEGIFNNYRTKFDKTLNNGYEILRGYRNAMHNNGLYLNNGKNLDVSYRGFYVHFENGKTMNANYKLDYWIIRDTITLYKQIAMDSIRFHPEHIPIDPIYNLDSYK